MRALNTLTVNSEQTVYTLVVGLGKTGLSVVRYLRALGETVVVVDSRDIPPGLLVLKKDYQDVDVFTGNFNAELFMAAHRIVVSPGVALSEPVLIKAKHEGIEIIGDIDLFARESAAPIVGITGSNGKSTVTTLLTLMASQSGKNAIAGGNIGLPVLDALNDDVDLYVLELSSFQLESLQYLPMAAAVVLNISADHLDRYENISAYAMSKQAIYENAEILVLNKDDVLANDSKMESHVQSSQKKIQFTLNAPEDGEFGVREIENKQTLCLGKRPLIAVDQLLIKGSHNLQNALATLALGYAIGLEMGGMIETLKVYKGLSHRTQFVAEIKGVTWINDSKATNVGAAVAALVGLPGKHVLIAGGEAKGADFTELAKVIEQHCRAVVLIGKDAERIKAALPSSMVSKYAADMQSAVSVAASLATEGDTVLLAPACASFDMFENFEHRGKAFVEAVETLSLKVRS